MSVDEKRVINDNPNIEIPGARVSMENKSFGMFFCIALSRNRSVRGNPSPNIMFSLSLKISFVHLFAKDKVFISGVYCSRGIDHLSVESGYTSAKVGIFFDFSFCGGLDRIWTYFRLCFQQDSSATSADTYQGDVGNGERLEEVGI